MNGDLTIRAAQQEISEFLNKKGEAWTHLSDRYYRVAHLVEEVGELARAVINLETKHWEPRRRGLNQPPEEKMAALKDSLGDLLYHVFVFAEAYQLDLQEAFQTSMKNIKSRYLESIST